MLGSVARLVTLPVGSPPLPEILMKLAPPSVLRKRPVTVSVAWAREATNMTWPRTTSEAILVLAVTAPPTGVQVVPASREKISPAWGPSMPALENCPEPARMRLGLPGSKAMPPMDREVWLSVRGFQVAPPSVVFQMPPFTAPMYMMLLSSGLMRRDWTAPTTLLLGTITASPP